MAEESQKPTVLDMRQLGQTGLKRYSGFIFEEFLQELTGWKGIEVYKEMLNNDPIVGAIMYAIQTLTRGVDWRIQPGSEQKFDIEAAEFVESCMHDMSDTWTDTISEILSFIGYGHSYHEKVFKKRLGKQLTPDDSSKFNDGKIGWKRLPIRSQDTLYRWIFADNGDIMGVEQLSPPHFHMTTIPMEKALLFRTTSAKNNPEGKSIFRNAYRSWYMKKNIENIEGIGIERDLAGLPVALVPPELLSNCASADQKHTLELIKTIVTNIRRDEQEGVVFPSAYDANGNLMYDLKLLSTGGSRQFDTDKIVQRYDQRIAMSALADFILLGHEKVGSFALASSKTQLFAQAIGAFLQIICDTFNRHAIPQLCDLNNLKVSEYPKLCHGDLESQDLAELGTYLTNLASSGYPLFPNPELEKHLMKAASLPEPLESTEDANTKPQPMDGTGKNNIVEIPVDAGPNYVAPDTTPVNPEKSVQQLVAEELGTRMYPNGAPKAF